MGKIWIWDGTRLINGDDWNVMQEVVENILTGHMHDGVDSHGVPQRVDDLPEISPERYGTIVFLNSDSHIYLCVPP